MILERAFAELRPAMFALAYRITGSRADADDIVQEAFLRRTGPSRKRRSDRLKPTSRRSRRD